MKSVTCAAMTAVIDRILCMHGLLDEFSRSESFTARLVNSTNQTLEIRRSKNQLVLSQHSKIEGDELRAVSMGFEMIADHLWIPSEPSLTHVRNVATDHLGSRTYRERLKSSRLWADNIATAQFDLGTSERLS